MADVSVNTMYEPFSEEPEYVEANRAFVGSLDLGAAEKLLDLACGTCIMADLVIERRPGIAVFALDLDLQQLELAQSRFRKVGIFRGNGVDARAEGLPAFLLVEGSADTLPFATGVMDIVIMGHSIHNLPDKDRLLQEIGRVLRPGGLFAFNSAFYAGTYVPGTEKFYQAWIKGALEFVMRRDREAKAQGLPGVRRTRGTVGRAFSNRWPSADEWKETLTRNGLHVTECRERSIEMTRRNFETIGSYAGFACSLLSGYPPELASEALQTAVAPAMDEFGLETVPQGWLEMSARKPEGGAGSAR